MYCVIYVNDKYGRDSLRGLEFAVDRLGITLAESQTINRGDRAFTAQVTAFSDAGCTVIFAITVPTEQNAILAEAAGQGLDPVWLGLLPAYLNLYAAGLPDLYTNFYVALDAPNLNDTSIPGMAKFLERFETYGTGSLTTFLLSGYYQTIAVHALLEKAAALGDFSRAGMQAAMAQLGEVDYGRARRGELRVRPARGSPAHQRCADLRLRSHRAAQLPARSHDHRLTVDRRVRPVACRSDAKRPNEPDQWEPDQAGRPVTDFRGRSDATGAEVSYHELAFVDVAEPQRLGPRRRFAAVVPVALQEGVHLGHCHPR